MRSFSTIYASKGIHLQNLSPKQYVCAPSTVRNLSMMVM